MNRMASTPHRLLPAPVPQMPGSALPAWPVPPAMPARHPRHPAHPGLRTRHPAHPGLRTRHPAHPGLRTRHPAHPGLRTSHPCLGTRSAGSGRLARPSAAPRRAVPAIGGWSLLALALSFPGAALAQPFGPYVEFSGTGSAAAGNGCLVVPDSPALAPATAITLEGWVDLATPFAAADPADSANPSSACRSLIGKDASRSYWLGVCGSTVRASFRGAGSEHDAGTVPAGRWTHVAVTYDGTTQSHYIDGELIQSFAVSGPPGASSAPLEIGGDVSWPLSPRGALAEFRLWNVARTVDQIRGTINVALSGVQPGLVAAWGLAGTGGDALGLQNGTFQGTYAAVSPRAVLTCASPGPGDLCLVPAMLATVRWRTGDGAAGAGTVVPVASTGSGIFWFFGLENWELMVKAIDACTLNGAVWLFTAATTNVFYRLEVMDVRTGVTKIYFNYPGPPAPAVTDTVAFPGSCS